MPPRAVSLYLSLCAVLAGCFYNPLLAANRESAPLSSPPAEIQELIRAAKLPARKVDTEIFSCTLPAGFAEFKKNQKTVTSGELESTLTQFKSARRASSGSYHMVEVMQSTNPPNFVNEAILQKMKEGAVAKNNGKIISSRRFEYKGCPAEDFEFDVGENYHAKCRIVVNSGRQYLLNYGSDARIEADPDVKTIFSTMDFKISPAKPSYKGRIVMLDKVKLLLPDEMKGFETESVEKPSDNPEALKTVESTIEGTNGGFMILETDYPPEAKQDNRAALDKAIQAKLKALEAETVLRVDFLYKGKHPATEFVCVNKKQGLFGRAFYTLDDHKLYGIIWASRQIETINSAMTDDLFNSVEWPF